jgi:Tol biopolymer transport system component
LLELSNNNVVHKIVALPGPDGNPIFSPDGKQLAFQTVLAQPYYYYTNGHIAIVDLATVLAKPAGTPSEVRDMTGAFDEDTNLLDWGSDGIYLAAQQKTNSHVYLINPQNDAISPLTSPDTLLIRDGSFTRDFQTRHWFSRTVHTWRNSMSLAFRPSRPRNSPISRRR